MKPKSPETIITEICERRGVSVRRVRGKRRSMELVAARVEIIRALHAARPKLSLPAIGYLLRRHHTTVLHHLQAHQHQRGVRT